MIPEDFPLELRVRAWAFLAMGAIANPMERLILAEELVDFLWGDRPVPEIDGETVH